MKKLISLILALLIACTCVAFAEVEDQPYAGATLRMIMDTVDMSNTAVVDGLQYCADKMGITLEIESVPSDQYLSVVNTKLTTGDSFDLLHGNKYTTMLYDDAIAVLDGDWVEHISPASLTHCINDAGEVKMAPLGSESNMGLLYNTHVLDAAGVELPIMNYSEFLDACEKIKAAGYTPLYISNKEDWTAQILMLCSMTSIFNSHPEYLEGITTNQMKPGDIPELVKLLENVLGLRDLGYVNEDYLSATNDMAYEAIVNDEVAFYAMVDGAYGILAADYPEALDYIGMTFCPMWDNVEDGMIMANEALNYLYAVDNDNVEISKAFINTMLSEDCLVNFYTNNPGRVPYENLDFDCPSSPFNAEMTKWHEETDLPYLGQWNCVVYSSVGYGLADFEGRFPGCMQKMFAGMSIEEGLETWYNNYAATAQALRLEGWE